jgi:hypothetical protein
MNHGALILILLAGQTYAADYINFSCQAGTYWKPDGEVLVEATFYPDTGIGLVQVTGGHYVAMYKLNGFNHRWDFSANPETVKTRGFEYSFVIEPDGTGLYYDFSASDSGTKTRPSQVYRCKQTEDPE